MVIDLHAEYAEAQQALVVGRGNALTFLENQEKSPRPNAEGYVQIQRDIAIHTARCDLLKDDSLERYARWEKAAADRQERFQNRMSIVLTVVGILAAAATIFQGYLAYEVYQVSKQPLSPPAPQIIRVEVPVSPTAGSNP